ncbi:hypothetical protein Leryth_023894 [Lithospermum erythrorhizon]|nr:hypothetical protein Leryth_023894 [Lithospermum erythrorhizon]
MSDIVTPEGWSTWRSPQYRNGLTFVENNCRGPGSNRRYRVKYMRNLSQQQLNFFTSLSFIDNHG